MNRSVETGRDVLQENAILAEIGRILSSSTDIDSIYAQFAEQVQVLIPFDRLAIATLDIGAKTMTHRYVVGHEMAYYKKGVSSQLPEESYKFARIVHDGVIVHAKPGDPGDTRASIETDAFNAGLRSGITVALISNDAVVGVLSLRSKEPEAYELLHLELAQRVGAQIAGAIANTQLQEYLRRLAHERTVLADIGRIISSSLDINEVYEGFASKVKEIIPFDRISISTIDLERNIGATVYTTGIEVQERRQNDVFKAEGTLSGEVAWSRRTELIHIENRERLEKEYPGLLSSFDAGLRSYMAVPLISNDHEIGVLHIRSTTPGVYSSRETELTEQVGAQIAGAIANSRLHASVQRDVREREALAKIGQIVSSSLDINDVYEQFAETVQSLIELDNISINIIDAEKGIMQVAYHSGTDIPKRRKGQIFPLRGTFGEKIIAHQAALLVQGEDAVKLADELPGFKTIADTGVKSFISSPLISKDVAIGVLNISTFNPHAYEESDRHFLERVATQIAGAIANSQLLIARDLAEEALREREEEQRQLARNNQILAQIGRVIGSTLDIKEVYDKFAELVTELVPSERITVSLTDEEKQVSVMAYVSGRDVVERMQGSEFPTQGTLTQEIIEKRAGSIIQARSDEEIDDIIRQFPGTSLTFKSGFKSVLGVPLFSNDSIIGTIQFRSSEYNKYTPSHLVLAERVADQIAGALANSQLYEQRILAQDALRAAEEVQRILAEENAVLATIGRIIGSSLNIGEVYESFSDEVSKLIAFDRITVNVVDLENGTFKTPYSAGTFLHQGTPDENVPLSNSITEIVVRSRSAFLYTLDDSDCSPPSLIQNVSIRDGLADGLCSFLSVPLISKGEVLGVFHLRSKKINAFTDHDVLLAERIAYQISGAFANAKLYDELIATEEALKNLANDLSNSNEELAFEISERKRFEEALRDRAEELTRSNTELEQFAYVASHDLQEPLRKIMAFGDLLRTIAEESLGDDALGHLERMLNAADRMQILINDLLTFSRVTTNAQPFQKISLGDIAKEVISDLEARINETGALIEIRDMSQIEADPLQMRQIFQNLIGNALKFHRPGESPKVNIFCETVDEEGLRHENKLKCKEFCRVTIEDNGIGFDEKYLDRIFTIFQRLHGRNQYEGTGIGLAICRKIADRHHGAITAKSSQGGGASFMVTIPFSQKVE